MHKPYLHSLQILCAFTAYTEPEMPESIRRLNGELSHNSWSHLLTEEVHFRANNSLSITSRALEESTGSKKALEMQTLKDTKAS